MKDATNSHAAPCRSIARALGLIALPALLSVAGGCLAGTDAAGDASTRQREAAESGCAPPQEDGKVAELMAKADETYTNPQGEIDHVGNGDSVSLGSDEGYRVFALVQSFRATGNIQYMQNAMAMATNYMYSAPVGAEGYRYWYCSWFNGTEYEGGENWNTQLAAGMALGEVVAEVMADPRLDGLKPDAQALADEIEHHVFDKWTDPAVNALLGGDKGLYSVDALEGSQTASEAGYMATRLYQATGKQKFHDYASGAAARLKESLVLWSDDSYSIERFLKGSPSYGSRADLMWDYVDTSHGNTQIAFAAAAFQAGFVFDDTDMKRFINTVKKHLWDGSTFGDYVTLDYPPVNHFEGAGTNQASWVRLAAFDGFESGSLRDIYYTWLMSKEPGSPVVDAQMYATLASILAGNAP